MLSEAGAREAPLRRSRSIPAAPRTPVADGRRQLALLPPKNSAQYIFCYRISSPYSPTTCNESSKDGPLRPCSVKLPPDRPGNSRISIRITSIEFMLIVKLNSDVISLSGGRRPPQNFLSPIHAEIVVHPPVDDHLTLRRVPQRIVRLGVFHLLRGITHGGHGFPDPPRINSRFSLRGNPRNLWFVVATKARLGLQAWRLRRMPGHRACERYGFLSKWRQFRQQPSHAGVRPTVRLCRCGQWRGR